MMLFRCWSGKWTDRGLAGLSEKIVDKSQREVSVWYLACEIVLLPFLEKACHTHTCHTHAHMRPPCSTFGPESGPIADRRARAHAQFQIWTKVFLLFT